MHFLINLFQVSKNWPCTVQDENWQHYSVQRQEETLEENQAEAVDLSWSPDALFHVRYHACLQPGGHAAA